MAGASDTPKNGYRYFEDFLVTAIGDLPEVDVQSATGVTTAILANQPAGVVEIPVAASDDDDVAAVSTNLNHFADAYGPLVMEARLKIDTSIADMKFFVGFGDSIASGDETSFSATTDTVTIDTMSSGVGFLFDNDATTKNFWCVAGYGDAVTVGKVLNSRFNFAAAGTYKTFRVSVGPGGKSIEWSIDGEVVHRVDKQPGSSEKYIDGSVALAAGVWNYEQGTAYEIELDYIEVNGARYSGDSA